MLPAEQEINDAHPPAQLQLRTLVLRKACVQQASLERLLTMTPKLRRLKCIAMQESKRRKCRCLNRRAVRYDSDHLYQHGLALPYKLNSFHFSTHNSGFSEKSLRVFPTSTEWTVNAFDLPLSMMSSLQELLNHVTTLELAHKSLSMYSSRRSMTLTLTLGRRTSSAQNRCRIMVGSGLRNETIADVARQETATFWWRLDQS